MTLPSALRQRLTRIPDRSAGFTLIELMITVAIVGILAAVAYPAYTSHVAKGRRAECRSGLMQAMQQQERYFTQYNAYAPFGAASAAVIRKFSGDNAANSACINFSAEACAGSTITNCVLVEGQLRLPDPDGITHLSLDSNGGKACKFNSGSRVTGNTKCWP